MSKQVNIHHVLELPETGVPDDLYFLLVDGGDDPDYVEQWVSDNSGNLLYVGKSFDISTLGTAAFVDADQDLGTGDDVEFAKVTGKEAVFNPVWGDFTDEFHGLTVDAIGAYGPFATTLMRLRKDGEDVLTVAPSGSLNGTSATFSGNMTVDGDVTAGGVVVSRGSSGQTASTSADHLVVENSGHAGISILTGVADIGSINFGDSGDADVGRIQYKHGDNYMRFSTLGSEKMRISSSGEVGIGTTTPSEALDVVGNATFSGRVGIGGPVGTSSYALRVHGSMWADSIVQINELAGSSGVGNIFFYNGGATFDMELYGSHAAESVKGIMQLRSKDVAYTSLANSILHADPDFLDHATLVWRSRTGSEDSFMMANYHHSDGAHIVTSKADGGDGSIRFKPNGSESLVIGDDGNATFSGDVTAGGDIESGGNIKLGSVSDLYFAGASRARLANGKFITTQSFGLDTSVTSNPDTRLSRVSAGVFGMGLDGGINDGGLELATLTASADVEITDATKGVILKSPDGTRYRVTVANGGNLTTTAI